uniref:Reverse transcriptase domain-containing protein n=1 Tax=Arundo donax TaxID=35708 RepID=A0A0A9AG12_ARUDO
METGCGRRKETANTGRKKKFRDRYLGLVTTIEKIRAEQRARLSHIREDDANTKLFHLRANGRRRRNYIQVLQTDDGLAMNHEDKEREIAKHFEKQLGRGELRSWGLNREVLNYQPAQLTHLDEDIEEDEVKQAIFDMPNDKAPGPDGFIAAFYKSC